MANYNESTGKWQGRVGEYDSELEANKSFSGGGGGGGGFGASWLKAIWKLFCLIPKLIGGVIGHLTGFLIKLGMVGKVLLTALIAVVAFIILVIISNVVSFINPENIFVAMLVLALALLAGAWFWMKHYQVVRQMAHGKIVSLATQCVMIAFWGPIILGVFFGVLSIMGKVTKNPLGFGGSVAIPFVAAIVYWLMKAGSFTGLENEEVASDAEFSDEEPSAPLAEK